MLAGFDIHVSKPVDPGELVAVVARLVAADVNRPEQTTKFDELFIRTTLKTRVGLAVSLDFTLGNFPHPDK